MLGIIILLGNSGYSQDIFSKISKKLYRCQLKIKPKEKDLKGFFYEIRMKVDSLSKFCSSESTDTIFFLESFSVEDGTYYGKIWDKNNKIEYTYYDGNFDFSQKDIFTLYACGLLENWDLAAIRNEEKLNSTMTSPLTIFGSRAIIKKGKVETDCIRFKEFYNLERDR